MFDKCSCPEGTRESGEALASSGEKSLMVGTGCWRCVVTHIPYSFHSSVPFGCVASLLFGEGSCLCFVACMLLGGGGRCSVLWEAFEGFR